EPNCPERGKRRENRQAAQREAARRWHSEEFGNSYEDRVLGRFVAKPFNGPRGIVAKKAGAQSHHSSENKISQQNASSADEKTNVTLANRASFSGCDRNQQKTELANHEYGYPEPVAPLL